MRWTNGQSEQKESGSNSVIYPGPSSSVLFDSSSVFALLSPLADPDPKHSAAGRSCQYSPIPTAPHPSLCISLDGGGFALGPRTGELIPVS